VSCSLTEELLGNGKKKQRSLRTNRGDFIPEETKLEKLNRMNDEFHELIGEMFEDSTYLVVERATIGMLANDIFYKFNQIKTVLAKYEEQ